MFSARILMFYVLTGICSLLNTSHVYSQSYGPDISAASQLKTDSITYSKSRSKDLSIETIISEYKSGKFIPISQQVLNAGIADQSYWIHFSVVSTASASGDIVIDIDNARLNELELFNVYNNTGQSLGKLGDSYHFYARSILHKNFLYQVTLLPGEKKDFFLFVNQVGHAFILPIKIFDSKHFRSTTFRDYLFDGVTYGFLFFVAVLSLLFFITSRHALYLYYGLYIITAIIWFLSYFGLGFQYLWPGSPALNTAVSPCMAAMNVLLNLQICQILLRLLKTNTLLNSLANVTKVALFIVALFPIFINLNLHGYAINFYYLTAFLSLILFAMLLVSCLVVYYAFKGLITARFYLVASLLKAASIINLALLELGLTPAYYNMEAFLQVGIFIEIALLSYALAIRYTNYRVKTFEKVIEAHENERALISKEIHDGVSSSLTGINYGIKNFTRDINHLPSDKLSQLNKIFEELNKVQLEARNISHNTMPDYILNRSISDIVEKHVEEVQNKIKLNHSGDDYTQINFSANEQIVNFSEAVKLNIFRIIQEILTNILKHANARNAEIIFSFSKREMTVIAEDDGTGFSQSVEGNNKGMGLKNLKSRVYLLDGSISIKSPIHKRPDSASTGDQATEFGTMIRIRIPYKNNLFKGAGYDY